MVGIIVARASNNIIGNKGQIPWYLPEDMKYFKEVTTNNVVIMGRNTYNSIGKPLPNRINIVVSAAMPAVDGILIVRSLDKAILIAKTQYPEKDVYLIGGHGIYQEGIKIADKLFITEIQKEFEGDTTFADFKMDDYIPKTIENHSDEELPYCFMEYTRK